MQRLGVSRAAVSRRLFSNNANAKKDSSQPELVQAGAGRILSTGIVVAGAAVAYNMHVDDEFRCSVEETVPGASDALARVTGEEYKACAMKPVDSAKDDTPITTSVSATAGDGGGMSTPNFSNITIATPFDKAPQILDKIGEALEGKSSDDKKVAKVCKKKHDREEKAQLLPLPTFGLWNPFGKGESASAEITGDTSLEVGNPESGMKLPKFSLPKLGGSVEAPEVGTEGKTDLLPLPNFEITNPFRKAELPNPSLGDGTVKFEVDVGGFTGDASFEVEKPESGMKLPKFSLPKLGGGSVEAPEVNIEGKTDLLPLPDFEIRNPFRKTELPNPSLGDATVKVDVGDAKLPSFSISISKPDTKVEVPDVDVDINLPTADGKVELLPLPNLELWNPFGKKSVSAELPEGEASTSGWGFGGFTLPKIKQTFDGVSVEVPEVEISGSKYEVNIEVPEMPTHGVEISLPSEIPEISIEAPAVTRINMGDSWGGGSSAGVEEDANLVPFPLDFWAGEGGLGGAVDFSGSTERLKIAIELPDVDVDMDLQSPAFDCDVDYDAIKEMAKKPTLYLPVVLDEDLTGNTVEIVATVPSLTSMPSAEVDSSDSKPEVAPKSKKSKKKWPLYDPVVYEK